MTLSDLMEREGMAGVAGLVLSLIQEQLCMDLCQDRRGTWRPGDPCCDSPKYEPAQRRTRRFRTRVGVIRLPWRLLRCRNCRKTLTPLREFLGIDLYQSKTSELERTVVEVVSEQSYRRGSSHLEKIGSIPVPKSTAHRWVAQSECDGVETGTDTMDLLFADGTGYKRRPDPQFGADNKGEVRIAFGIENTGDIRPLGAWSGEDWKSIAEKIQGRRRDDQPVAELLIGDGERGLLEALGKLCDGVQRCHWHAPRDLNYVMWKDNAPLAERKASMKRLAGILAIDLPAGELQPVSADDKSAIASAAMAAEREVDSFCRQLLRRGYTEAYGYVKRMKRSLFTYVDRWLELGLISPRAASYIERTMREIARRLKRIAHGWSQAGAAKMARIVLKRFTNKKDWDAYWKKKLRLEGNVMWLLREVKLAPTPLGR
jgi:hypothetical protein